VYILLYLSFLTFFSSIPYSLLTYTLQNWQLDAHMSIAQVSFLAVIQAPYFLNPVWGGLIDRYRHLVDEQAYMLLGVSIVTLACYGFSIVDPSSIFFWLNGLTMCLGASWFDAALGSYRSHFSGRYLASVSASIGVSYRVGMILFQAGLVVLASQYNWQIIYRGLMYFSLLWIVSIIALHVQVKTKENVKVSFKILTDWLSLKIGWDGLIFFFFFNASYFWLSSIMLSYLRLNLHIDAVTVAETVKFYGMAITLSMSFVAAWWIKRFRFKRMPVLLTIQVIGQLVMMLIMNSSQAPVTQMFELVCLDSIMHGFLSTIIVALILDCAPSAFPATGIALLTSISLVARLIIGSLGGWVFENMLSLFWLVFFVLSIIPLIVSKTSQFSVRVFNPGAKSF